MAGYGKGPYEVQISHQNSVGRNFASILNTQF